MQLGLYTPLPTTHRAKGLLLARAGPNATVVVSDELCKFFFFLTKQKNLSLFSERNESLTQA